MKQNYPSGSNKQKKKKDAEKNIAKLPKLTNYFATAVTGDNVAVNNVQSVRYASAATAAAAAYVCCEVSDIDTDKVEELSSDGHFDSDDDDDDDNDDDNGGVLVSQASSASYSPSPRCANPAATNQSTVDLLTGDPALWPKKFTAEERCSIVCKGPIQISVEFSKNQEGRRFTSNNYHIQMKNGEKINRTWLIYSESWDCVMCFCCRLFGDRNTQLSSDGFNNRRNLGAHLKQHESSAEHVSHIESWNTLSQRLQTGTAIDQLNQNAMMAEIDRWRNILRRLLAIIMYLAERILAFRGSTEKLYEHGNGNFLGEVQLMAKFDPFMKEHLRRIQEKELSDTYLSKHIQNEGGGCSSVGRAGSNPSSPGQD